MLGVSTRKKSIDLPYYGSITAVPTKKAPLILILFLFAACKLWSLLLFLVPPPYMRGMAAAAAWVASERPHIHTHGSPGKGRRGDDTSPPFPLPQKEEEAISGLFLFLSFLVECIICRPTEGKDLKKRRRRIDTTRDGKNAFCGNAAMVSPRKKRKR